MICEDPVEGIKNKSNKVLLIKKGKVIHLLSLQIFEQTLKLI